LCQDSRRKDCVKIAARNATSGQTAIKILEAAPVAAIPLEYKYKTEGMDAEAVVYQIKQRFLKPSFIPLSAYCEMP
jgi:hypothetical protein